MIPLLARVVDALRPRRSGDGDEAGRRIDMLADALAADADARRVLRRAVFGLFVETRAVHLFTDSGILSSQGFAANAWARLNHKLLPERVDREQLKDCINLIFARADDYRWVMAAPDAAWLGLMHVLGLAQARDEQPEALPLAVFDALEIVSCRITALGLEPEIVRIHPDVERYESPFLMQNVEMRALFDDWRSSRQERREATLDDRHLLVLLDQCDDIIARIRKQADVKGASISLTQLLARLTQNIKRARRLLATLQPQPDVDRNAACLRLMRELVAGENRRESLRDLFSLNLELVARRVTSHAGRAGEAYITATRQEYFHLFRSAMGAGLLVAIAAFFKITLGRQPYPLLWHAAAYSLNYAWCFMLMAALHWSLASKQPAMTGNRIARSMDDPGQGQDRLDGLAEVIVRTARSQFVALVGNIVSLIPLALVLILLWRWTTGTHYVTPAEGRALLVQADPLNWHLWLWASITGVWLFAAGLISGYYDNRSLYGRIPDRIRQLRWLGRLLGERGRDRFATFIDGHIGALMGSFWFGVLMGSTGTVGTILGLPIDILHVTFSTANSVYGVLAVGGVSWGHAIGLVIGVCVIATLNLAVSFALALYVAMRARRVRFRQTRFLLQRLRGRLRTTPWAFLYPPRESPMRVDL